MQMQEIKARVTVASQCELNSVLITWINILTDYIEGLL